MSPLHLVCPHCLTVNRVISDRLSQHPLCGQCKLAIFTGYPLELNGKSFGQHISRNDIPVLVDFWAPWCGPCKMMAPAYSAAAKKLEPGLRVAKLNTEQEQAIAGQYNIRSIPTLILFKGGHELARHSGALSETEIIRWVSQSI